MSDLLPVGRDTPGNIQKSYIFLWSALLSASFLTLRVVNAKLIVRVTLRLTRCTPDILRGVNSNFFDRLSPLTDAVISATACQASSLPFCTINKIIYILYNLLA